MVYGNSYPAGHTFARLHLCLTGLLRSVRVHLRTRRPSHLFGLGSSSDCGFGRSYTAYRRDSLARGGTLQSHPLVARTGSRWSRRVLLLLGAGAHSKGGRRSGTKRIPKRWLPRSRSTHQGHVTFDAARAEANQARGQKQCGPSCRTKLAAEAAAKADVEAASQAVLLADQKVHREPVESPVWLLPAALDVVAFMAIWTGLIPWGAREEKSPQTKACWQATGTKSDTARQRQLERRCLSYCALRRNLGRPFIRVARRSTGTARADEPSTETEMFKSRKPKPPPEFWTIEKACAAVEAAQEIADDHPLPGSIVHRARLSQVRFPNGVWIGCLRLRSAALNHPATTALQLRPRRQQCRLDRVSHPAPTHRSRNSN